MEDQSTTPADSAPVNSTKRQLAIWRGLRLFDNRETYVVFECNNNGEGPQHNWLRDYLNKYFVRDCRSLSQVKIVERYSPNFLAYVPVDALHRLAAETNFGLTVLTNLAYLSSSCAVRWLENVSYGGIEDYDDLEDIEEALAHLSRFLALMVSFTTPDPTLDRVHSEWELERARDHLRPLLGRINPRWEGFALADFAADLQAVRSSSRKQSQGRRPLAGRDVTELANELIRAWESEFETTAGRGTSKKSPFYVLGCILRSTEIVYEYSTEETAFREFPDDESSTLRNELFGGNPPVFLRALDANYKLKTKSL